MANSAKTIPELNEDDFYQEVDCPNCDKKAEHHTWSTIDGGSYNSHWRTICEHCGHTEESMFA